jgi:flagellum-specific ATP synthase
VLFRSQRNHYPAIDVLASISRLAPYVSGPVTTKVVGYIRRLMAVYSEAETLINVGAYHTGSNPAIDEAIAKRDAIEQFLIQMVEEKTPVIESLRTLGKIANMEIPDEELSGYQV